MQSGSLSQWRIYTRACDLVNLACALVKYVLMMNSAQSFAASSDWPPAFY